MTVAAPRFAEIAQRVICDLFFILVVGRIVECPEVQDFFVRQFVVRRHHAEVWEFFMSFQKFFESDLSGLAWGIARYVICGL